MQTQYGLGRNMELLEEGQIVAYQKVCMFAYGWVGLQPPVLHGVYQTSTRPCVLWETSLILAGRICEQATLHRNS
jgi:hypothetical protein